MIWARSHIICLALSCKYDSFSISTLRTQSSKNRQYVRFLFGRLPFSLKTPLGYAVTFLLESVSTFAVAYSILPALCFAIGNYLLVVAAIEVITNDFRILCEQVSNGNDKELKKLFSNMIEDIIEIKQLSDFN